MSSSDLHQELKRCQRLRERYTDLLARHQYLTEQLANIQDKITSSPAESHDQELLDAIEQRLQALQNDPWLDKLFSVAQNEAQVKEIERLMQRWGQANYESVSHCIVDHANRHHYPGNYLRYLRKAASFNKKRARKSSPAPRVLRWNKGNDEYLIEREGQIVSYGSNKSSFKS